MSTKPNYNAIFNDIVNSSSIKTNSNIKTILSKNNLCSSDVLKLNSLIFKNSIKEKNNQKYKSYDEETILKILDFQRKNDCTNVELSNRFSISRNSIAKWKKIYTI